MGVDIAFHIEVRHQNKWHAFHWQTPMVLEKHPEEDDKGKEWKDHICCYCCRYYHFEDLIEDSNGAKNGLPDDCSDEIRKKLEEYSTGSIPFEDIVHFCDKAESNLLSNLSKSKECQITKSLQRIEKVVRQKQIPKSLEADDDYRSNMSIKEIYEEYQDEITNATRLRDIVWALMDNYWCISGSDIRLIYCIC